MTRTEIINILIKKNNYKTYLEIGVNTPLQPGYNWNGVQIETKHGVDPEVDTTYKMTSDEFFEKYIKMNYDIIFIDGLHIFEQVYKDIINSLNHLNNGGVIVVHDCHPKKEITQRRIRATSVWHGDVWKAILKLRIENPNIQIYTINADEGCGIIQKGSQILLAPIDTSENLYTYNFFKNNKGKILNLISVKEFKKKLNIPLAWYEKIWK
jgi:hypothetical protein